MTVSAPTVIASRGSARERSPAGSRGSSRGGVRTMPSVLCGPPSQRSGSASEPGEPVSDAGHGQDVSGLRRVWLDLAPEVADVDVDHPRLDGVLVAPDRAEDPLSGEHLAGVRGQVGEKVELGMGEDDVPIGAGNTPLGRVDDQVSKHQPAVRRLVVAAQLPCLARVGPDPGEELAWTERLGDIVVGPDLETEDDIDLVVLGAEDDHRHPVARAADLPADVEPGEVGEHEIEHDDVRVEDLQAGKRLGRAFSFLHGVAFALARSTHRPTNQCVVVDNEHPHLLSIHAYSLEVAPRHSGGSQPRSEQRRVGTIRADSNTDRPLRHGLHSQNWRPAPVQTQGSLRDGGLATLLQSMQAERATGTLTIDNGGDSCALYFLFGHLFHASGPGGQGEEVVIDALAWDDGSFQFDPRAKLPAEETIKASPAELIAASESRHAPAAAATTGASSWPEASSAYSVPDSSSAPASRLPAPIEEPAYAIAPAASSEATADSYASSSAPEPEPEPAPMAEFQPAPLPAPRPLA